MKFFRIPFSVGLTIDDMGWMKGADDRPYGPPRLNSREDPRFEFYEEIIQMAKNCGTRVQGSFVMSEFDQNSICAKECYNTLSQMTEKGTGWTWEKSADQNRIMEKIREENAFLEFGLHGVRHGHYENGKWHMSEWASRPPRDEKDRFATDQTEIKPWDSENRTTDIIADCYTELLRQYFTEEELSFPESFAPPTHVLYYDSNSITTGAYLSKRGVKYCNAKITGKVSLECPLPKDGVIDHGMHILDRRSLRAVPFDDSAHVPMLYPRKYPWIEAHFKDFWYTGKQWSQYLYNINSKNGFMLAKNTEQVHSQWFYYKYAKITNLPGKIIVDTSAIPDEVYNANLLSSLVLKVPLGKKEHICKVVSEDENLCFCAYWKDIFRKGYIVIGSNEFMGRIPKGKFVIKYRTSKEKPEFFADCSMDTYNIYELTSDCMRVKIYGTQTIRLFSPKKLNAKSDSIIKTDYRDSYMYITLKAKSMNGDTVRIDFSQG